MLPLLATSYTAAFAHKALVVPSPSFLAQNPGDVDMQAVPVSHTSGQGTMKLYSAKGKGTRREKGHSEREKDANKGTLGTMTTCERQ